MEHNMESNITRGKEWEKEEVVDYIMFTGLDYSTLEGITWILVTHSTGLLARKAEKRRLLVLVFALFERVKKLTKSCYWRSQKTS